MPKVNWLHRIEKSVEISIVDILNSIVFDILMFLEILCLKKLLIIS